MSEIEKWRKYEIEMLKFVDSLCKKNNLKYFTFWGTLIGVIRHKGFIPWDDDVDICLPREDFDKLIHILKNIKNDKYCLHNIENDPNYLFKFPKLRNKKTIISKERLDYLYRGVFIDIYPYDSCPKPGSFKYRIWYSKLNFYNKLLFIKEKKKHGIKPSTIKSKLISFFYSYLSIAKINKKLNHLHYKYSNSPYMIVLFGDNRPLANAGLKSDFLKIVYLPFETIMVPVPGNYDAILRSIYGDYMKEPDPENKICHFDDFKIIEIE